MRKNWVVFTGLVRKLDSFKNQITALEALRQDGIIEGIVYSTWLGEIDKVENLRSELVNQGVVIVETLEPNLKVAHGHAIHQMKALYYGLQACPEGSFVLRLRPDIEGYLIAFRSALETEIDLTVDESDDYPHVFNHRLMVVGGNLTSPFFFNDQAFYGQREDLLKICHFDLKFDVLFSEIIMEQRFFSYPFLELFPIFQSYFQVSKLLIIQENEALFRQLMEMHFSSSFYTKVFATFLNVVHRYFRVSFPPGEENCLWTEKVIASHPFAGIFDLELEIPGIEKYPNRKDRFQIDYHNDVWIDRLLEGAFQPDRFGDQFLDSLAKIRPVAFHRTWQANPLRPQEEVQEFYRGLFGLLGSHNRKIFIKEEDQPENQYVIAGEQPFWHMLR